MLLRSQQTSAGTARSVLVLTAASHCCFSLLVMTAASHCFPRPLLLLTAFQHCFPRPLLLLTAKQEQTNSERCQNHPSTLPPPPSSGIHLTALQERCRLQPRPARDNRCRLQPRPARANSPALLEPRPPFVDTAPGANRSLQC